MTRKRLNGTGVRYLSCDSCPAVVPLVGDEKRIPEWKPVGRRGGIERHVCPRCIREGREAA